MSNASINNTVVNQLIDAYFSDYPVFYLTNAYDRVTTDMWRSGIFHSSRRTDHATELVKIVVSVLLNTLVDHGKLAEYGRYYGENAQRMAEFCYVASFPELCPTLERSEEFAKWTHMILYLISILRSDRMIQLVSGSAQPAIELHLSDVSPEFVSNVILLLYALLFMRLTLAANLPGQRARHKVESCMFAGILSFYYDFVSYTAGLVPIRTSRQWQDLYQQLDKDYLQPGRFFITLRLTYPLKSYLDTSTIGSAYGCVVKHYLDAYSGGLKGQSGSLPPDPYKAMECLNNVNLNSLSVVVSRWHRKLLNNKITRGVATVVSTTGAALRWLRGVSVRHYTELGKSFTLGVNAYQYFYHDQWPRASQPMAITCFLAVFVGHRLLTAMGVAKDIAVSATVFVFRKKDLPLVFPPLNVRYEKPTRPGYLRWDRNADGSFGVMYAVSPLPGAALAPGSAAAFPYMQGGTKGSKSHSIPMMTEALKKGYIKTEVSMEKYAYIRERLRLTTKMTGGDGQATDGVLAGPGAFASAPRLVGEDPLPDGWSSVVIDVAPLDCFFREDDDGQTVQLVCPKTELEKAADENAAFVVLPEPAQEVEPISSSEKRDDALPPPVPVISAAEPVRVIDTVSKVAMDAPPPPVDPIATLPTLTEEEKDQVLASTMIPPRSDVVETLEENAIQGVEPMMARNVNEIALTLPESFRSYTHRYYIKQSRKRRLSSRRRRTSFRRKSSRKRISRKRSFRKRSSGKRSSEKRSSRRKASKRKYLH